MLFAHNCELRHNIMTANGNFEAEESLLYSARHGEIAMVKALLDAKNEGKLTLDLNCKGMSSEFL